jgi:hypothetical protein
MAERAATLMREGVLMVAAEHRLGVLPEPDVRHVSRRPVVAHVGVTSGADVRGVLMDWYATGDAESSSPRRGASVQVTHLKPE